VATASPGASRGPGRHARRTILGLERQGLGWTLAIGAIALTLAVGLPIVDSVISADHTASPGSVTDVGLGVRITPVSSWSVVPRQSDTPDTAQFTRAGALVSVRATSYGGSAQDAYDRLAAAIDSQSGVQIGSHPGTVTTRSGLVGIASALGSSTEQGYFAVFVAHGTLAVVIAASPLATFHVVDDDMRSMIGSVEIGAAP
jgi:hypothetical protein